MAITPFERVTGRTVLGSDMTAVQDAINRCEHVLNLGTATATEHTMIPVEDQPDAAQHRRIYEATIRGWLPSPAPVIRRGGIIVPVSEYVLFAAQGAIIFHMQQLPEAAITAGFTHVTNLSALTGHTAATTAHGSVGNVVGTATLTAQATKLRMGAM